jgi:hypothetical protein
MVKITYPHDVELTKEQMYRHTVARGESLKNVEDGTEILVKEIVAYDNEDGNKIISILDNDNRHYVSNSSIFRAELEKIVEIFGSTGITLRIRKSVSKAGRTFVTCELG